MNEKTMDVEQDATYQLEAARRQLLVDLVRLKHEAGRLGMWRTMQSIDDAANAAGWEMAKLLHRDDPGPSSDASGT